MGLEMMRDHVHPKERDMKVPSFCLESQDCRVVTKGHFLLVVMPPCKAV